MAPFAFDPSSSGARRLALDWLPYLERWEMRVPDGRSFIEGDGRVIGAGRTIEVGAPEGQQLVGCGYVLVSVRQMRAGD